MNEPGVNYRALLIAKRKELLGQSRQREDIWVIQSNEQLETAQLADEREFAVRALEQETRIRIQVDAAIKRIDRGEFGICVQCEDRISPKRLAAVPWAAFCLRCQGIRDAQVPTDSAGPTLAA